MTDHEGHDRAQLEEALRALTSAHADAVDAIEARLQDSPQQAFEHASELQEALREMHDQTAELRTRAVGRIWESERLSLAALAQRIGVSKSRADEIVRAVKGLPARKQKGRNDG